MAASTKPMTKAQLVAYFAEKFDVSKARVNDVFDGLFEVAVRETKNTGAFTLPGIGKIVLSKRKARMGRNPATGETIHIPAKTVVKMRLSKVFKDAVVPPK